MDELEIYHHTERELIDFVCSEPFRRVLDECGALPEHLRHEFVELVLLDDDQLTSRGVKVPAGMKVQRSFLRTEGPRFFA
jgi:hypothetical protein